MVTFEERIKSQLGEMMFVIHTQAVEIERLNDLLKKEEKEKNVPSRTE